MCTCACVCDRAVPLNGAALSATADADAHQPAHTYRHARIEHIDVYGAYIVTCDPHREDTPEPRDGEEVEPSTQSCIYMRLASLPDRRRRAHTCTHAHFGINSSPRHGRTVAVAVAWVNQMRVGCGLFGCISCRTHIRYTRTNARTHNSTHTPS